MNIRFSIITVSYNSEATIRRTIDSIVNQTIQDFEYIIIDGASSDNTNKIIEDYKIILGDKLTHISEPDKGIYHAMNKGIQLARGEVVGIVNSDDWLEPDALETIDICAKDKDKTNVIFCGWMNFHYLDGTSQILKVNQNRYTRLIKRYRMGLNHPATFVPLMVYNKIGLFDTKIKISADVDFIIRCFKNGVDVFFVNHVLTNMFDGGISNRFTKQIYLDKKYTLRKHTRSRFEYFYYINVYIIKKLVKSLINQKLLFVYRSYSKK